MLFSLPSLTLLASISLLHSSPALADDNPLCNGHAELCSRKYSNITFIGAHDSPFVGDSPADNQDLSITDQLDTGIRYLQAQTHVNAFKILSLCHTNCFLNDAGSLTSYLKTIKTWLDKNPTEIVSLLLTNGDRLDPAKFDTAFKAAELDGYAYVPPADAPLALDKWPTLGDMIAAKTRLVVFLDYGAKPDVPYILDQFAYYFETPFDTTDPAFNQCAIDRPPNASPDGRMYVLNHYLDKELLGGIFDDVLIPDRDAAPTTNGEESIRAQVGLCEGLYHRKPNVVLLDFVDKRVGDVQARLNGL
ncbi:MAG: hypothetical protein L6R39_006088 [Caloplaca ligustica]|nr:MAG: hypothetical protein L6R39_006088 [Caloplaca ligustica]